MIDDEQDEAIYEKILAAAEQIKEMARNRPAEAPAMIEQARHLTELAEQIRSDWLRRLSSVPPHAAANPDSIPPTARDRSTHPSAEPTPPQSGIWLVHPAE